MIDKEIISLMMRLLDALRDGKDADIATVLRVMSVMRDNTKDKGNEDHECYYELFEMHLTEEKSIHKGIVLHKEHAEAWTNASRWNRTYHEKRFTQIKLFKEGDTINEESK